VESDRETGAAFFHVVRCGGASLGFAGEVLGAVVDATVIEFSKVVRGSGVAFVDVEDAVESAKRFDGAFALFADMCP
jgi:hypothetical protein